MMIFGELIATIQNHPKVIEYGGLFGLINNASVYQPISFDELTFEEFKKNFTIHVEVPFLLTKGLYEQLKAKSGSVIGLVDTSQGRAWKDLTHYTASKNALRQMMVNLAGDLHPHVRVNCIAPGAIISAIGKLSTLLQFSKKFQWVAQAIKGHCQRSKISARVRPHFRTNHQCRRWLDLSRISA